LRAIASIIQNNDRSPSTRCHFRPRWRQAGDLPHCLDLTCDTDNDAPNPVAFSDDLSRCDSLISTSRPSPSSTRSFLDSAGDRGLFSIDAWGCLIFLAIKYPHAFPTIPFCDPGSGAIAWFRSRPTSPLNLAITLPMPDHNRRLVTPFSDSQRGAGACPVADVIRTKPRVKPGSEPIAIRCNDKSVIFAPIGGGKPRLRCPRRDDSIPATFR
jgi:hypothetical protein